MKKIVYRQGDTITLFTFNKTANKKIAAPDERIVQTFHFSKEQFYVAMGKTNGMTEFFSHDKKVCFDCPFAVNNGAKIGACYTHKFMQFNGFLSSLRSIGKQYPDFNLIPQLTPEIEADIVRQSYGLFVRFGSYGEPTLLPVDLVKSIVAVAKSWTGYTHQWAVRPEFSDYYMASTHTAGQELLARQLGWRSFVATQSKIDSLVNCPASAEQDFKSNCSKCGLCSGNTGKGKKSVYILEH
jgi:hypothetical protein